MKTPPIKKPARVTFACDRSTGFSAKKYRAKQGGKEIATIQQHRDGSWFWYARDHRGIVNTCAEKKDVETCKAEITAYFTTPCTSTSAKH